MWSFAGLWETWSDPAGQNVRSFTIITGEPNELVAPIHNRMPVILRREHEAEWLSAETQRPEDLLPLLMTPYPADRMRSFAVSRKVNKAGTEGADLVQPLAS